MPHAHDHAVPGRPPARAARVVRALAAGALALLAACAESTAPEERGADTPAAPAAGGTATTLTPIQCVADVRAQRTTCGDPTPAAAGGGARPSIIAGRQGVYVQLSSSAATYNSGTGAYAIDVTVQNLIPQAMATADGVTPHPDGVTVFFAVPPTPTAGDLGATITIANADGVGTFTATGQSYFRYLGTDLGDGILATNETSAPKTWRFNVPATVTGFTFTVYVQTEVQYPNGYVDVQGDTIAAAGGSMATPTTVRTALGDPVAGATVTYGTGDAAVATVDAAGAVTAVGVGVTTITATSGARTGTKRVRVCPNLAVGQSYATSGAGAASLCLAGTASGAEYVALPFNTSTTAPVALSATASGIVPIVGPPSPILLPEEALAQRILASLPPLAEGGAIGDAPRPGPARGIVRMRWGTTGGEAARATSAALVALGALPPGATAAPITPGVPAVGDLMNLNVALSCNGATDLRTGRVRSVSQTAIVIADTANPAGGFTTAQYDSIALEIDTIAYLVDTTNFGKPSDLDANQRVVVFYTRAVNEQTPPASSSFSYGYFLNRDIQSLAACSGSNVGEMLYMLVPDPTGAVNSNVRAVSTTRGSSIVTIGHELQHLISASRRLAVNGYGTLEEPWLDEALSYVAEELMFYRTAPGLAPRQNIVLSNINTGPNATRRVAAFNTYENANFTRLRSWLQRPDTSGVARAGTASLAARGVAWAFLRYAVDRKNPGSEPAFWRSVIDDPAVGRAKLASLLGGVDLDAWQHDFYTSMYTDDAVAGVPAALTDPSWNYRSVYGGLGGFPLGTRPLSNGVTLTLTHAPHATAYQRFGVPASGFAAYTLTKSGGAPPDPAHRLMITRTK